MKSKVITGIMLTLLLTGMLTLAFNIQPSMAEPLPVVCVEPPTNTYVTDVYCLYNGTEFTVEVKVYNVTGLCGYDVWVGYNSILLQKTGLYVRGAGQVVPVDLAQYWFWDYSVSGMVKCGVAFIQSEGAVPFDGSGTLCWIKFKIIYCPEQLIGEDNTVNSTLDLIDAWTSLYNQTAAKISIERPAGDGFYSYTTMGRVPQPPIADFDWVPTYPFVGDEVICYDVSAPNGGEIIAWKWEIDGPATPLTPLNESVMEFRADCSGTVNVTLTVWDTEGMNDTTWELITIYPGWIRIMPDGSVDPPDAPISSVDNVTYILTGNIVCNVIIVLRENIVVDGAGYTIKGIDLGENNVTITNMQIRGFVIYASEASFHSIYQNNVTNCSYGIVLINSSNNIIYHNNFINNTQQVYSENSVNIWDDGYPSGGNYWSDYTDVDLNNDGIWDHPYVIDENNKDRYPLVNPWTPSPPPQGDLAIVSIEPIQVILDAEALVANKSSVIRVTVESTFPTRVWAEINVTYNFGTEWHLETGPYGNGTPIDPGINRIYIHGGPVKPTAYPDPWIPPNQPPWLFWTTVGFDSNIKAMTDPLNKISETDETNNEKTYGMKVVGSKKLRILVVPVYFRDEDRLDVGFSKLISDSARDYLLAMYPIADDKLDWDLAKPRKMPWYAGLDPTLVGNIYWFVARPLAKEAKLLGYDRVVIVIKPIVPTVPSAMSYVLPPFSNRVPVVVRADTGWHVLVAHEIGHTYYLQHPQAFPNGLGPPVFEAQRFNVAERSYEDIVDTFMDAYIDNYGWIDKERYDSDPKQYFAHPWMTYRWNLFDQLTVNPHETNQEIIVLSGVVFKNDTVQSEPWYRLAKGTPDLLPGTEGNYSIVLLDDSRQIIARMGFNASFTGLLDINGTLVDHEEDYITFDFNIPYIPDTFYIEVRDSAELVLLNRTITENPPIVNIVFPNGGEVLTAGVNCTITWDASDPDGDSLAYFVAYSKDGGKSWVPLALDITENNYVWDTSNLPSGDNYLVKIIATDGVNTGEDVSDSTFCIASPPVGGISIPVNKLELLTPYIALTILLAVAVTTVAYVKKRKRKIAS
ncbi:MAG: hypothetical protein OEZ40_09245 [Candidatus Bathyarchaeota archaeon]|nr:hypothetical protein [Candidatus Bathyarchaeota archaeon]